MSPDDAGSLPLTIRVMVTRRDLAPLLRDPVTGRVPPAVDPMARALRVLLPAVRQPVYVRVGQRPAPTGEIRPGALGVRQLLATFGCTVERRGLMVDPAVARAIRGGDKALEVALGISALRSVVPARDAPVLGFPSSRSGHTTR